MIETKTMKPVNFPYGKILFQFVVGIAFILILASIIKPPSFEITDDPFFIFRVSEFIYNETILLVTLAAKMIVYIAIGSVTMIMGKMFFVLADKVIQIFAILAQVIIEKYEENNK